MRVACRDERRSTVASELYPTATTEGRASEELVRYTAAADQARLARNAMAKAVIR